MDDQYIGKRCPACGLYLAGRKLAGPPVPATPSLEAIRRAASDDSWIPARMALPLVAEVERLTSERDTERALRIERDGLLAAERERFAVAYDAAQKLAGERDEARVDLEAARRDAATRQIIADDRWAAIERLEAAVEHFKTTNLALVVEVERLRGAVHESLAYDPYGMAGGAQIPLRALSVG